MAYPRAGAFATARPLVALMLLNLPFWALQTRFAAVRPIFDVDLALAAAICVWRLAVGVPFLLLAWALDAIRIAAHDYHFLSEAEFLASIGFAGNLDLTHFFHWGVLGGAFVFLTAGVLAILTLRDSVHPMRGLLAWTVLICLVDGFNGSMTAFGNGSDRWRYSVNIAGSPGWNLYNAKVKENARMLKPLTPSNEPLAFNAIEKWHVKNPGRSILVIIVESMGLPNSPIVRSWLQEQLFSAEVKSRWTISESTEHFLGSTTYSELRVLCGLFGHYKRLTPESASGCLPARLSLEGYTATGMHGFTSKMFEREQWWPMIGLKYPLFAKQFSESVPHCGGPLPGVCDSYIIDRAVKQADQPNSFVYALTLNTHLPLEWLPIAQDLQGICNIASVDDQACQLISQLSNVLGAVARSLKNSKSPPFVVVVGDHAPPFIGKANRRSFSSEGVPLFLLTPLGE